MVVPFFVDKTIDMITPVARRAMQYRGKVIELSNRIMLNAIAKLEYKDLEEIDNYHCYTLKREYNYRSPYNCSDFCSVTYRYDKFGVCCHGNKIKTLKNITYHGKMFYK